MPASLPRTTPAAESVDPRGVLAFIDAAEGAGIELHSLMVLRHGKVVAEGWWDPYTPTGDHLLYSLSKSFTSTAIGIAQGEGLLSIDDLVVDLLPDHVTPRVSERSRRLRLRHLLAMASGHASDTIAGIAGTADPVTAFLEIEPDAEPGTLFCYNQGCTYTLSAIIHRLTGQQLHEYLGPRLFQPMGIEAGRWTQMAGIDQGYSGLHAHTEDVAKLGQLHLQDGLWEGHQLVPAAYATDAHRKHSDNSLNVMQDGAPPIPDWQQGYGFQFWVCTHQSYRGDGAYGQFCVVIPGVDAVIACTAQTLEMQRELDLIWEHLLPAVSGSHPADPEAESLLAKRLAGLRVAGPELDPTAGTAGTMLFEHVEPRAPGTAGLLRASVETTAESCRLTLVTDRGEHIFDLAPGSWTEGTLAGVSGEMDSMAISGGWDRQGHFVADLLALHAPHRLRLTGHHSEGQTTSPTLTASWSGIPLELLRF